MRLALYLLAGLFFMLMQTTVVPWMVPSPFKPNLLLILIIYLSLGEDLVQGAMLSYLLGCLQDVFAGSFLGLYGFVCLVTFLAAKISMRWLDTERSVLLLILVFFGTLFEGAMVLFLLATFAEPGHIWPIILGSLPTQALASTAAAWLLLLFLNRLQKRLGTRIALPGLQRLDSDHGF